MKIAIIYLNCKVDYLNMRVRDVNEMETMAKNLQETIMSYIDNCSIQTATKKRFSTWGNMDLERKR